MSNYEALGFCLRTREEAEALARAPLRAVRPQTVLLPGGPVEAYCLPVGQGIELWTYVRGRSVAAAFPFFRARAVRQGVLTRLSQPASDLAPRIGLQCGGELACQLVNVLQVPAGGLVPGALIELRLAALAGDGLTEADGPAGLAPPDGAAQALAENVFALTGTVLEAEVFANAMTGVWVRWMRVNAGEHGELEVVGRAEAMPEQVAAGTRVRGQVTLRGAVVGLPDSGWRQEGEEA